MLASDWVLHKLMCILNISKDKKSNKYVEKSGGRFLILMHGESRCYKKDSPTQLAYFI